jgi:hypothetical protein
MPRLAAAADSRIYATVKGYSHRRVEQLRCEAARDGWRAHGETGLKRCIRLRVVEHDTGRTVRRVRATEYRSEVEEPPAGPDQTYMAPGELAKRLGVNLKRIQRAAPKLHALGLAHATRGVDGTHAAS